MDAPKDNLKWWVLITVIIGTFLGRLDQTIVNLALPKIITDYNITVSEASWIATAYILANAVFVPVWGKLGDSVGRKKVYVLGFTGFIIGSILAGLAWDLNSMIVFRVIQAIAGSADYPTAMAILAVTFKAGKDRAQALGLWSASFAAASVFGPLVGGPLIDNFGWRSVFLVNVPVGLVGLAMALIFVRESVSENKSLRFDWWGAITLGICLSSLVLVLDKGMDWGWTSSGSIACYISIVLFAIIFYMIDANHPEPIVDFRFFKNMTFNHTLINNFIIFMGMMGGVFTIPVFAQTYLGYDATQTGLLFMPMAAAMMLGAPIGAKLVGRVESRYVLMASTLVASVAMLMFTGLDVRSSAVDIMIPVAVMAFGMGFGMAQRTNIIVSVVPEKEMGVASSLLALARNIAGAFGIALFATILKYATEDNVMSIARNTVINTKDPAVYQQVAALIILKAQVLAYHQVFYTAAALLFVGVIAASFIKVKKEKTDLRIHIE